MPSRPTLLDHPSDGLLFPSSNNPEWPTDPGILRRRIHARWKTAGLKPLGFHEGRHTFASIGIAAGLNAKTLSTYLGHATITITLDRYGHLMPGSEIEARAMLDAYLDEGQGSTIEQPEHDTRSGRRQPNRAYALIEEVRASRKHCEVTGSKILIRPGG